jgi:hypothetical protein
MNDKDNPPDGFVVPNLPFENAHLAWNKETGQMAYWCPECVKWIVGNVTIHIMEYKCMECEKVISND